MDDLFPTQIQAGARRGRGAVSNRAGRFEPLGAARVDDGWEQEADQPHRTALYVDQSRKIITRNQSPDVPFDRSINPYKGCEHGCIYCFARPTHEYLGLSAGLDFETHLFTKPDAAKLLELELRRPGYAVAPIAIGTNTDPYQPIERDLRIMRSVLKVLEAYRHPVMITTKGGLITRDIDILSRMARHGLARVQISVTTLDTKLHRAMEPRASAPTVRLRAIAALAKAGVPVGANLAPVIPALNDHEMEAILSAATKAGAESASYITLRLPGAVAPLFREWLEEAYPKRAKRIMRYVQELHGGKDYSADWGKRMKGEGVYAAMIARRFAVACGREGLNQKRLPLECGAFRVPARVGDQLTLL